METRDAIFGRRSVRKFTPQVISLEDVHDIIDAGLMAPSGINLQPWYFVVVRSEEKLAEIRELMSRVSGTFRPILEKRFAKHPEAITDTQRFFDGLGGATTCILAFLLKQDYEDHISVIEGVSAAMQNIALSAYDKGLGTCWITAPLRVGYGQEFHDRFAPDKGDFVGLMTLGYPAQTPIMPPRREGRYTII